MRSVVLLAMFACGDKPPAEIVAPTNGSTVVVPIAPTPDAAPITPSRIALRASGKPPIKTTKPLARDQLSKLAALELDGLEKTVRKLDDAFLDVEYQHEKPSLVVGIAVQPCLRCLPMQLDRWRAESDALRVTIPPDLRDRKDVTFEIDAITIGGTPAITTHQLVFVARDVPIFDHAVTVYFTDGVNQIRVIASYDGTIVDSFSEMSQVVTRAELEQLALAVLDRHAQAWN